jgi:ATP-binding cassette subfamily B protein
MKTFLPKQLGAFVWHFLKPYRYVALVYVLLGIGAGLWTPLNSVIVKKFIDLLPQASDGNVTILMLPAALIVINFIVFDNFTWRGINYLNYRYQGIIKQNIITETYAHVLSESNQFFQDNLSGRISSQITNLTENIETILYRITPNLLRGGFTLLVSFIACYQAHPIFFYILFIWFVCFSAFSVLMSKRLVSLNDEYASQESMFSGQLVDSISNSSSVRIFARKTFELSRIQLFSTRLIQAFMKREKFFLFFASIQGVLIAAMMCFSSYALVYLYSLHRISVGDFALILGLAMALGHMMWWTMDFVSDFSQTYGKCKQHLNALMTYPEIQDKENAKPLNCSRGEIQFQDVQFHYKGSEPLFQNKSVIIPSGQKVGLVGYSGGGKTTFVNLILRLYDVSSGQILIDKTDIRDVTQDSLHEAIAMIPQDPSLFQRTLKENIRYGRIEASDEEVIEAAKKAHAHEFISLLPNNYESLVGERGVKLSGGQRQRIAIARAILKNAPILILDEATSQLDSVTEKLIQDSLWNLMQGKTTIVIAHRLSTLLQMDRILVFDKGKIVEDGSHHSLLANNGLYKTLWNAQVGGFLYDNDTKVEDE